MSEIDNRDARFKALQALIDSIDHGPDAGLNQVHGKDDPESIQQQLTILLDASRVKEAADLVRNREPNERWSENAILALSRNGELDTAHSLLRWAEKGHGKPFKQRCSIAFADGTLFGVVRSRADDQSWGVGSISEKQRQVLLDGLQAIAPMITVAKANGAVETALEARAAVLALEINQLLGDIDEFSHCAQVIIQGREDKIPLDFAFAVLRYAISIPPEFPDRLRKDYPDSFEAGLLAAMIDAQILGDLPKAFHSAYTLQDRAVSPENREQLFKLLVELAQKLGEARIQVVDEIASTLIAPEARFFKLYTAAKHLQDNRLEEAEEIIEETRNEQDPEWLQMCADLELKRGKNQSATDCMIKAAKLLPRPELLAQAAQMARRDGRTRESVKLLEQLLSINPRDAKSRNLLASLLFELKSFKDAARQLEVLRRVDPNHSAVHMLNEATNLALAGNLEASLKLLDSVCSQTAELPPILERAQLLKAMDRPVDAFNSLQAVRDQWWNDPDFLSAFMSTAYAAGNDGDAHEAFLRIRILQTEDKAPTHLLQEVSLNEMKLVIQSYGRRKEIANRAVLVGKMPWILADRILNRVPALGWAVRTQELNFLAEEPSQRAEYSLYATNGFAVKAVEAAASKLEVLEAPTGKKTIVADLSALITLNHLGLLDRAAGYYETILIPADYHQTAIDERSRLSEVQLSRVNSLKNIKVALDEGSVVEFANTASTDQSVVELREHIPDIDTEHRPYRIRDIASALFELGEITEKELDRIHKVAHKPALAESSVKRLKKGDAIVCDLSTMMTLDAGGCLEKAIRFFRLHLTSEEKQELVTSIRHYEFQEKVRKSHAELWDNIRKDSRFVAETYEVPSLPGQAAENSDDLNLALSSSLLAQQKGVPLLADDRACQALALNSASGSAFGTDKFLDRLAEDGQLEPGQTADFYLELMRRRYRFLVPTPGVLKTLADRYEQHPPGRELREVARYLHDCMRDPGLFGGVEKTQPPTIIANRFFFEWTHVITDLIVECWSDESYSEERASLLTNWAINEFLPSPPSTLFWRAQRVVSSSLPRMVFSRAMIHSVTMPALERANKALVSIAKGFGISQDTYEDLVIGAINVFGEVDNQTAEVDIQQQMKMKMLAAALAHTKKVSLATNIAAELNGVSVGDKDSFEIPDFILPALRGLDGGSDSHGPLLIHRKSGSDKEFALFNIADFLFHQELKVRGAALGRFERMRGMKEPGLILRSEKVIDENSKELRSNDALRWKRAAVAIADALKNDFLLNLGGFRQCLGIVYDQGASEFFSRLIRPSVDSIDTIPLKTPNPTSQNAEIVKAIDDIVKTSKSLKDGCERYYEEFGHIPLAGPLSMGGLIEAWIRVKGFRESLWSEVWQWANKTMHVLARYHACQVFLYLPAYIPRHELTEFWKKVTDLIAPLDAEPDQAPLSRLELQCVLTKHFIHYLECQLPGEDSERIAVGSLAIAERLISLLVEGTQIPGWILNSIQWEAEISRRTWQITHPVTKDSILELAALYDSGLWGSSLLGTLSMSLDKLDVAGLEAAALDRLSDAVVGALIEGFRATLSEGESPTFPFQVSSKTVAETWMRKFVSSKSTEKIEAFLNAKTKIESEDFFRSTLPQLIKLQPADQILTVVSLRGLAFTDKFPDDLIWQTLTQKPEESDLLAHLDPKAIDALLTALIVFQGRQGGKWAFELPHVFAAASERVSDDPDRQELLFDCTVLLSTASGTVSAIERLLVGSQKQAFQPVAVSWRERLLELMKVSPLWAAGRMRGILASLPSS